QRVHKASFGVWPHDDARLPRAHLPKAKPLSRSGRQPLAIGAEGRGVIRPIKIRNRLAAVNIPDSNLAIDRGPGARSRPAAIRTENDPANADVPSLEQDFLRVEIEHKDPPLRSVCYRERVAIGAQAGSAGASAVGHTHGLRWPEPQAAGGVRIRLKRPAKDARGPGRDKTVVAGVEFRGQAVAKAQPGEFLGRGRIPQANAIGAGTRQQASI